MEQFIRLLIYKTVHSIFTKSFCEPKIQKWHVPKKILILNRVYENLQAFFPFWNGISGDLEPKTNKILLQMSVTTYDLG